MDITSLIFPFLTGGLSVFGLQQLIKKGKTYLNDCSLVMNYHTQGGKDILDKYTLDLQFTNTSGHTRRIKFIGIDFTVGSEEIELLFEDQPYPPAYVLKEKEAASFHNELIAANGKIELPFIDIVYEDCIFKIRYSINDKEYVHIIRPSEFKLKNTTINRFVI